MVRYFLIALAVHGLLFLNIDRNKTLGNPDISVRKNIPISYNTVKAEQKIDNIQKIQKNEIKQEKIQKAEPEIKSKMSSNKQKKEPEKEEIKNSEKLNPEDEFIKNGNFTINSDGSYTAVSSKGINFEIITQKDPAYPKQAEMIRYNKTVVVEVRFLVDLNGNIEDIKILKSHEKFGFDKEVLSALKKWKFKPIIYKGRKIKVYFNKEFVFTPKK